MSFRVGIDIGGTFTDLVFLTEDGAVLTAKVPSTPDDYSRGIGGGMALSFETQGIDGGMVNEVIHGTTIATNAILEKTGAETGLLTTDGFRDVLEIRRLRMPRLYDLTWQKPEALVTRAKRLEIMERIDHLGQVLRPLDEESAVQAIERLLDKRVDVIAVGLINSYANDVHEQRLRELIRERAPKMPICLSSEILPEIKEYERISTTVVNAYIVPVVEHYLRALASTLKRLAIQAPLLIMQSNGGAMGVEAACLRPIHIIESGPAAGVVGAAELARKLGRRDVLTFDMGGTTAKAAMIEADAFDRVGELDVGAGINSASRLLKGGGYHVRVPAIDIAEVGAGGGSLVRLDAGGGLGVGPESAGAVPGPVCYDQGGEVPTVTDANVVLGYVNPGYLVGGDLRLNKAKAEAALRRRIAEPLGIPLMEAAYGIHQVANATMARALRSVSSERGRDPRCFSLMAFGGSGPVHAATLAGSLEIGEILVPPVCGVFSALGLLFPETEHHYVRTFKRPLDRLDVGQVEELFQALEADGIRELGREGYARDRTETERHVDLRYRGENTELTVPLENGAGDAMIERLHTDFGDEHERTYGYQSDDEVVDLVNLRVIARGRSGRSRVPSSLAVSKRKGDGPAVASRRAYFGNDIGVVETPVLDRDGIDGDGRDGPLIIEEYDSTTVVPPGWRVRLVAWNTLVLEVGTVSVRSVDR